LEDIKNKRDIKVKNKTLKTICLATCIALLSCTSIYSDYEISVSSGSLSDDTKIEDLMPRTHSPNKKTPYKILKVAFEDPTWYDANIPQHRWCKKYDGTGKSPALFVRNIPKGANAIVVEFNDVSCNPLAYGGGLGAIRIKHHGGFAAYIPSVKTESHALPKGVYKEKRHNGYIQSSGVNYPNCDTDANFSSYGEQDFRFGTAYLAPCSGGAGHAYIANVKALYRPNFSSAFGQKVLGVGRINMGIDDLSKSKSIRVPRGFNQKYR
jgi:hypothetical protein